jgi:hypothetical protein
MPNFHLCLSHSMEEHIATTPYAGTPNEVTTSMLPHDVSHEFVNGPSSRRVMAGTACAPNAHVWVQQTQVIPGQVLKCDVCQAPLAVIWHCKICNHWRCNAHKK